MTNSQKVLAGGVLLIVIGIGGYFAYKLYKTNKTKKTKGNTGGIKIGNLEIKRDEKDTKEEKREEIDMGQKVELGEVEDRPKSEDLADIPRTTSSSASQNAIKGKYQPEKFPIGYLMKGSKVKAIQTYLNKKYKAGLKVDGYFGEKTLAALKKYMNLESVDEKTYAKMIS